MINFFQILQQLQQFKSVQSNCFVVFGWIGLVFGKFDIIEIQFDVDFGDLKCENGCFFIEYWVIFDDLIFQSVLLICVFNIVKEEGVGWCVFVFVQGCVLVCVFDFQFNFLILVSYWINVDFEMVFGIMVNVNVNFFDFQFMISQNL